MTEKASADVIPFSKSGTRRDRPARCVALEIRGEVTFEKPRTLSMPLRQPLLVLASGKEIPQRLQDHLERLDEEQLQIVELVAAAIERGAL